MNIDLNHLGNQFAAQFRDLQGRQPGQWPLAPRLLCAAGVMAAVIGLGYFFYWDGQFEKQKKGAREEASLRTEYKAKMAQAINLEALQAQKAQVDQYVARLEKQLPSKSEMAELLSDINQAGVGRGLQFELFKPGQEVIRDYYAELPINIKVSG
jgi:type IV pilus assembly protein PilO